jgi:hypothetical protein
MAIPCPLSCRSPNLDRYTPGRFRGYRSDTFWYFSMLKNNPLLICSSFSPRSLSIWRCWYVSPNSWLRERIIGSRSDAVRLVLNSSLWASNLFAAGSSLLASHSAFFASQSGSLLSIAKKLAPSRSVLDVFRQPGGAMSDRLHTHKVSVSS